MVLVSTCMNNYTPKRLMRQPAGYWQDNQNPTEDHIDQALLEALRTPAPQYIHNRVWLPHREENGEQILDKLWEFYTQYTTTAFAMQPSTGAIQNCRHMAVFMLVPEDEKTIEEGKLMKYDILPNEMFEQGLFRGDVALDTHVEIAKFGRYYANWHYSAAMVYALHLQELGYDVGSLNCGILSPKNFNEAVGEHLPEGPVHPMITVFAGTNASALRHTGMRDTYDISTVAGKSYMNAPWNTTQDKTNYLYNTVLEKRFPGTAHGLVKWNKDRSDVVSLTDEELKQLHYDKYTNTWKSMPKAKAKITGGEFTY